MSVFAAAGALRDKKRDLCSGVVLLRVYNSCFCDLIFFGLKTPALTMATTTFTHDAAAPRSAAVVATRRRALG